MPPQQTSPGFEAESDATALGRDLTMAVGKAADETRNAFGLLKRTWRTFRAWGRRWRSRTALHELSDRELMDIGVMRDEIGYTAPQRAIDALRDCILSRGMT